MTREQPIFNKDLVKTFKELPSEAITNGKYFCGIDPAKEGSETMVEGYMHKGEYYITKITQG